MADLIDRNAVIKIINDELEYSDNIYATSVCITIRRAVNDLPSAQSETNCSEFPNNSDTISRQAAIEAIHEDADWLAAQGSDWQVERMERDKSILKSLPCAEPQRKKGRWINAYPDIEPNPMFMYGICSECGFEQSVSDKLNYCPNCGAKMER